MMPGESRSQAAEVAADAVTAGSASCLNCDTLQQNLNEYVTALIALKQKIIDTDHVLTEYQKKCDELQKTERDCKTLRDQLDELLQKFAPLEKCKEEMDAMRIELEEKRSSVKMYQQTHLEFNELQQEQTKNDALKKKLESRIKRLEETTTKQNTEIKQLRKEKTTLERNLKKTQEKLMVQQKNGVKVLKDAQTQNATQEIPTAIDKSEDDVLTVIVPTDKVKVLLEEIWLCIEKSNVQEKPNKRNTYSPGKRGPSQKKCKTLRSSLLNPSHSSPLETSELPTSSPSHQLECDQEENNLSKMDESLTDEGLKSNSDSAFYDDKTVELTRQNDPIDTSSTDSDGGGDDDGEQDALSRQLQEILDWTEPLPPQLSPLPCSPSTKKQILFGDITDSSDDDGGSNLPGRSCHESVPETDQLDSSGCTEVLITDQPSTVEAGISASMIGELSAEKMDCSEAETEDLNEQCLTTVEVEDELSDPCLIAEDDQCRNENSTEAHSLFEETVRNSVPRTPEMYNVDSLLALKAVHEKNLTPPQYNYNDGMQRDDITEGSKNTVVSIVSNLKAVEPELERSKPCNKEEYGISTCVKEVDKVELELQDASTCGQLGTTFEAMEVVEIHCNNFTCDSQKDECTTASVLPSDMEHTKVESTTKEQISTRVMEELIPLSQLNRIAVHGVAQDKSDECIPTGDMEMEEINCNSATSDGQKGECTQISLQPVGVELPQAESLMKEQNLNKMEEITPPAEVYCSMETGVSQEMSKNCISTGCTEMEEINSGSSILDNQKDKFIQTSVPASDFQQTHTAFETVKHSRLDTIQEITPLDDFNCAVETSISQDKSKNFVCTEDTEMAKINSASLISDNQKDKCTLTSVSASDFEQTHTALVAVKQSGLDKRQEVMALDDFDCPVETSISQNKSKNFVCTEMAKINSASLISDNQKDTFIQTSVPASDFQQTHTAFETVKHSRFDTIQEITPLDVFNCPVETSISQDKSKNFVCTEDTEMAKINSASLISDNQKDKCMLTSVPASDFEQTHTALVAVKQSGLDKRQEVTSLDDFDCPVETSISQNKSKNFLCTEDTEMAKINSASLISDNQKDKCMLTSVPASDFEQTHTALVAVKQSGLNKMQEVTPLDDFDCPVETSISQDKSKNFVCTDDTEMEEINSGSSICDNRKDKCTLTSMLSNDIEEFAAKEQNGLGKTDNSVTIDVAKDRSRDCVRTGGVEINDVDAKSSTFDSPNNEIAVPSKQEFIQQTQSDLLIKKGSLNELQEVSSLKSDCSMVADVSQDSFNDNRDMEMEEVDSDRAKDECISTLVPFHIQLAEGESTTKGQDCLSKMEQASPFVEFDGSVIPGVIQGKCKDYISTQDVEVEEVSCNECTLILVQSSTEESQTKSTIKEHGIITKTKEACSFLESDCSFVATDLDQVKSTEYTSTVQMSNKSTRAESTGDTEKVKLTVCGSPVDKWNEGNNKLMENEEKEKSDIEEIINGNVRLSGECLSSDQIGTQFEINTYSTQSSSPCVLQYSVGQENFMNVGQNKAADTLNNNVVESEENANSEKNEAMSLKSRKLGNELQLSLQEPSTTSTQIYQMNENPQNSEAEVSMLVRKIKRKQWHRKILTPERETQDAINHKMVEMEITAEACIAENLNHELKVHTGNHKQETEHHSLSVNGHVTVQCADLPFDSKSVSESKETVCNIESITNAEEESVTVHPDCIETQPELVTLDEDFSQDTCQTPVFRANQDTNMNFEDAGENGDNTMSVKCKALDLDTPALKICDDEPLPKLSPNIDMLGCMQIENNHLVENNYLQNETEVVEKSKSTSEDCSNLDSNFCIKEQFGIRVNKNAIGIAEEMPNCIPSVKKVNNSTNTPIEETSSHISLVQKVDSSTQTELTYNGLQTVLYTSSDLLAAPKSLPQMDIVEGKVGMPKAKKHSSYCDLWNPSLPDVPSDHQRPIHTVALGGKEVLFESTVSNPVDMESFGTSECEQTSKKTAKNKKSQVCKSLPRALIEEDGDVQQDSSLQKSNIQSTYKSHVVLRRNRRGSNANDPPVLANTDTSAPVLCTQEIHQVMLEMGQPLPPLLLPLVATPPRTARATRPISPLITTSSVASLCSPVDDLASPSKETSKAASVSPPLDHTQQKSPSMHSPSPLEFARNERIQSSPLQFCTATPKHAVPVPGRLPQSASTTGGSALPQENSVKILDAMYPNLSARARTLNILRGNVQLSIRGPADGENQAGAVNQIMGFKAINSAATAFVKAGSNSRSEGTKTDGHTKDLEHQQPAVDGTSSTVDRPKKDHVAAKRSAEDNGAGNAKRVKTENNCQQRNNIADFITPQESSTVNVIDTTKSLYSGLVEQKTGCKTEPEHFPQPLEPINSSEEAVATALMKITKSCFDLLPVVRSHVFVGNIPQMPVLRDEEKEVICELSGNKDLTEALLMAIIKKLKAEQTTLDGNRLQALSRVYVAICRQQGDLERARLLSYSILKEDFPDSSKLLLHILSVWQNIFSMQGPVNKAMQAVAKQRAKGDVLNCLSAYLNWEKNPPLDVSSLVSSFLIAMQQSPKVRFQTSNEYGMDFNGDMWELIYAIDLLCSQQQWTWTHNCFIRNEVWPVMDKWMKRRKGQKNVLHIQDATVAGVMRLIGRLGQQGLKKESVAAVRNMAAVINKFLQQAFQEGVPWPVQLSAVYAVYDLAPSNPKGALEALHTWKASVTEPIPSEASSCLMELETLCERLNSEIKKP